MAWGLVAYPDKIRKKDLMESLLDMHPSVPSIVKSKWKLYKYLEIFNKK